MKKLFILLAILCATVSDLSAQILGIHPRFEAGVSLPKIESSLAGFNLGGSANTGYRVGAAIELPVLPFVYLAPGAALRSNRVSYSSTEETIGAITNVIDQVAGTNLSTLSNLGIGSSSTLTYVIVPVNLGLKVSILGLGLSAEAGPYAGYAINSGPFSESKLSGQGLKFNKFTYGIGANVAALLGKAYLRLGYEYELSKKFSTNSVIADASNPKYTDNGFYLTLGYKL